MAKKKAALKEQPKPKYRKLVDQLARYSRQNVFDAFLDSGEKSDRDYWECLSYMWSLMEGQSNDKSVWLMLFESRRPDREKWLMTKEERAFLKSLPEVVTIYRGCAVNRVNGLSWTTDREKGIWFGNRFNFKAANSRFDKDCCLVTGTIPKSEIFAVIHSRDEYEVVVDPKKVKGKKKEILSPMKSKK